LIREKREDRRKKREEGRKKKEEGRENREEGKTLEDRSHESRPNQAGTGDAVTCTLSAFRNP
jgi:hypothetical protein